MDDRRPDGSSERHISHGRSLSQYGERVPEQKTLPMADMTAGLCARSSSLISSMISKARSPSSSSRSWHQLSRVTNACKGCTLVLHVPSGQKSPPHNACKIVNFRAADLLRVSCVSPTLESRHSAPAHPSGLARAGDKGLDVGDS